MNGQVSVKNRHSIIRRERKHTGVHKDLEHEEQKHAQKEQQEKLNDQKSPIKQIQEDANTSCTMADVFGTNESWWPNTASQAKQKHIQYCEGQGYPNNLCQSLIEEHWLKSSMPDDDSPFAMTPKFCEESVELLKLDGIADNGHRQPPAQTVGLVENQDCDSSKTRRTGWRRLLIGKGTDCHTESTSKRQVDECCFPNTATVSVRLDNGIVVACTMDQLRVGDSVLTEKGFSKVFAFMDHVSDTELEFVHLETQSGFKISLTPEHILFAHLDKIPVQAQSIVKGDVLWTVAAPGVDLVSSRVASVTRTMERGQHAPLTEEGTVMVDGILSSSYAVCYNIRWGQKIMFSGHDLCKNFHEPLRLACSLKPSLCESEWHSADIGRHLWTKLLTDNLQWLIGMNRGHNDLQAAFVTEASFFSWMAGLAQLGTAASLSMMSGSSAQTTSNVLDGNLLCMFLMGMVSVSAAHMSLRYRHQIKSA